MTGPVKRDQVGTCTNTLYHKMLEFYVQYLLSVSCKMLPIKCFIDGKISLQWHQQIISYDATNLKNMINYVPT